MQTKDTNFSLSSSQAGNGFKHNQVYTDSSKNGSAANLAILQGKFIVAE